MCRQRECRGLLAPCLPASNVHRRLANDFPEPSCRIVCGRVDRTYALQALRPRGMTIAVSQRMSPSPTKICLIGSLVALGACQPIEAPAPTGGLRPIVDESIDLTARLNTVEQFNEIIMAFRAEFGPIAEAMGFPLAIETDWESDADVANADIGFDVTRSTEYRILFHGGWARRQTPDGVAGTLCHELGHYTSGHPHVDGHAPSQLAIEGQADYFEGFCLRQLWRNDAALNARYINHPLLTDGAKEACDLAWSSGNDRGLCYRISAAALDSAHVGHRRGVELGYNSATDPVPAYETPERLKVPWNNTTYGTLQCRLDTRLAAAHCNSSHDFSMIPGGYRELDDPNASVIDAEMHAQDYYCSRSRGDTVGVRPLCWFRPQTMSASLCAEYGHGVTFNADSGDCDFTEEFCRASFILNPDQNPDYEFDECYQYEDDA